MARSPCAEQRRPAKPELGVEPLRCSLGSAMTLTETLNPTGRGLPVCFAKLRPREGPQEATALNVLHPSTWQGIHSDRTGRNHSSGLTWKLSPHDTRERDSIPVDSGLLPSFRFIQPHAPETIHLVKHASLKHNTSLLSHTEILPPKCITQDNDPGHLPI